MRNIPHQFFKKKFILYEDNNYAYKEINIYSSYTKFLMNDNNMSFYYQVVSDSEFHYF